MATRMQQRRGTAAQWTSANPILNAGEMGWESDTNKFKIGDGTNHWADLDYFIDQSSTVNPAFGSSITFEGSTSDAYETTLQVTDPTADRTITLPNATGTVVLADGSGNVTVSGNLTVQGTTTTIDSTTIAVTNSFTFEGATADAYETTLTVTDPTADRTITLPNASGTVITTGNLGDTGATSVELGYLGGVTSAIQLQLNDKAPKTDATFTGTLVLPGTTSIGDVSSGEISHLNGVTSAIQTQLDSKLSTSTASTTYAPLAAPTFSGTVVLPSTTSIGNVSNTEIGYLDGVTSGIQGQLDSKSGTAHTHLLAAGATDVTASAAELNIMDGVTATTAEINKLAGLLPTTTELNYVDGVTSSIQTQLDGKSATGHTHTASDVTDFTEAAQDAVGNSVGSGLSYNDSTGAISVDTSTIQARVTDVSDTEIGYLNGVTSAIQTQLDNKLALAGGTLTGALTLNADPSSAMHAATKQYVDAATAGLNVHESVDAATTANITLASAVENGDTLDGVTLATGNRILVKNQTTKSENGIYIVAASGAPTRATDYDSAGEVDAGDFIFVEAGTVNGKTGWVQTNVITTVGTDEIEFTQFSGAGTYAAGTGLTLTGNIFSINTGTTADLSTAQTLTNKTIALGSNTVSGTTAQFNSALTDGDFATLAGTETLTNKTLTSPTMTTPTLGAASATSITFSDGTQSLQGVPSITPIIQKTDSYTLSALTERDNVIEMGKATAQTLTIPTNATVAYPVGTSIDVIQTGAGQVTIAGAVGVTVNATPGLKLRAQWSSATLFKRATDTWIVMGDLSA